MQCLEDRERRLCPGLQLARDLIEHEPRLAGFGHGDTRKATDPAADDLPFGPGAVVDVPGVVVHADGGELMGEDGGVPRLPADDRAALHDRGDELLRRRHRVVRIGADAGPRGPDVEQRVIVGPAGRCLLPLLRPDGFDLMHAPEFLDPGTSEVIEVVFKHGAMGARVRAVEGLPALKQQRGTFKVPRLQSTVLIVHGVRERMGEISPSEPPGQGVAVIPQSLLPDFVVHVRRQAPDEDMQLATILGEVGRDLLTDDDVGEAAIDEFDGAVDRVVVGECDEVHAAGTRLLVDAFGGRVAFGDIEVPERAHDGAAAGVGVTVHVHPEHWGVFPGSCVPHSMDLLCRPPRPPAVLLPNDSADYGRARERFQRHVRPRTQN